MTVNVGTMQLPVPEDPDAVRTYLNGTHVSGGLWTALTRSSNHDHSGGTNGIQLTATSIPDGSITTAKLDPSVLGPYALVDGSKPFTGQVAMNADAIVRDTVYFGQQGSAGAADATLSRTGAGALRLDNHLGVGATPAPWGGAYRAVQVGVAGSVYGTTNLDTAALASNLYSDGTDTRAIAAGAAASLAVSGAGGLTFYAAPAVAAGAVLAFATRAQLPPSGTFTLTPAAGQAALVAMGNVGIGVAPAPWHLSYPALQIGPAGSLYGNTTVPQVELAANSYNDGAHKASVTGPSTLLVLTGGGLDVYTSASTTAGGTVPYALRARVTQPGGLALTPVAGTAALTAAMGGTAGRFLLTDGSWAATNARLGTVGSLEVDPGSNYFMPARHNTINLGNAVAAWLTVFAQTGTIQASTAEVKEGLTPLDPLACYQAAKDVRWYEFAYLPPAYTEPEPPPDIAYDASDDNDTKAEKKALRDEAEAQAKAAHLRMVAETAPARHQRGFVFPAGAESKDEAGGALPPVPDLFGLSDRESTTPQADIATLGCALQEVIRRLETLEGAAA